MDIELKEGEVICDNCHGKTKSYGESLTICKKCWGTGKLDWIDLCVGKKSPFIDFYIPKIRQVYPKIITSELLSIQPMR
jgi:RecJ-like exonuclease